MSERSKRYTGDTLFIIQLIFALGFCGTEFIHLLGNSAEGVSVTMFFAVEVFLLINLVLSWKAHLNQPSRITFQTLFVYGFWTVLWGADLILIIIRLIENPSEVWSASEYTAISSVLIGLVLVFIYARTKNLPFRDPIVRGCSALVFKAVPQLFQAWKFFIFGGASWTIVAILFGHITIFTRLGQLWLSLREAEWDRNRIGSAISEVGNELSWLLATGVWVWWKLF